MKVVFYFDPICPYSWITSRWLITVQNNREKINVSWQLFSLAIKNSRQGTPENLRDDSHYPSHRVLRVITAAGKQNADIGKLYTTFGNRHHIEGEQFTDDMIRDVLKEYKLSADLLQAADDPSIDVEISNNMNVALGIVGDDAGTPIIIFDQQGQKSGYFGPVLISMPSISDSLKLWDSLVILATSKEFYELKRSRHHNDADTASTAVCIP